MQKVNYWIVTLLVLSIVGCGETAVPTLSPLPTLAQPTIALPAKPAVPPTAVPTQPAPATVTAEPTTATELEDTAVLTSVFTAEPTGAPEPTGTAGPSPLPPTDAPEEATAVPQPTSPPPPPSAGGVEQPPYEASACSDKYPCNDDRAGWEARIRVPPGFTAAYFARLDGRPTSIAFGPDGMLYVALQAGSIYKIDNDGAASFYIGGFQTPTGIAFQPGTGNLYVSDRLREANVDGESRISIVQGGASRQIIGGLPCCYVSMHAANGIAFGPDGWGYVGVGARADHGEILGTDQQDELHPYEAAILRFSPDGSLVEVYARGVRNPYDIAWDASAQLWATDNAPDYGPPEELQRIIPGREHGYPWYDCDVCFSPPPDVQIVPPSWTFVPHSSPTGITAYLADQFPGYYNSLFLTFWSAFSGAQKVVRMTPGGAGAANFATGFAAPIDVTVGPDGSLYVADWATGIIIKISYTG